MEIPLCMQTKPKTTIECKYTDLTHPLDSMSLLDIMQPIIKSIFTLGIAFHLRDNIKDYNDILEELR